MGRFEILLKIIYFTKEEYKKILEFLIAYMGFEKVDTYKDFDGSIGGILIYTKERTLEYHLSLEDVKRSIDNNETFYTVEKAMKYIREI